MGRVFGILFFLFFVDDLDPIFRLFSDNMRILGMMYRIGMSLKGADGNQYRQSDTQKHCRNWLPGCHCVLSFFMEPSQRVSHKCALHSPQDYMHSTYAINIMHVYIYIYIYTYICAAFLFMHMQFHVNSPAYKLTCICHMYDTHLCSFPFYAHAISCKLTCICHMYDTHLYVKMHVQLHIQSTTHMSYFICWSVPPGLLGPSFLSLGLDSLRTSMHLAERDQSE